MQKESQEKPWLIFMREPPFSPADGPYPADTAEITSHRQAEIEESKSKKDPAHKQELRSQKKDRQK